MAKSPKGKKGKKSSPAKATKNKEVSDTVEEDEKNETIEDAEEKTDMEKENQENEGENLNDAKTDSVDKDKTNEKESTDINDQTETDPNETNSSLDKDNEQTEVNDTNIEESNIAANSTENEPMEVLNCDSTSKNDDSVNNKEIIDNDDSIRISDGAACSDNSLKQTSDKTCNNELQDDSILSCGSDKKNDSAEILSSDSNDVDKSFESDEGEVQPGIAHIPQHFKEKTVEDGADWNLESRLESFLKWCEMKGITLSPKVKVTTEGVCHRYGMIATEEIKKGDLLFTIPRAVTLHPDNSRIVAEIVDYEDWLDSIGQSLDDSSGWATLLIALMLEFNDENSYWAPYLRLVPQPEDFGHPLFWTDDEHKEELQGTTLLYDVQRDVYNIVSEYKQFILPFIYRYKDICGRTDRYNFMLYKRLVAFVMAYSFTEDFDSQPGMIPMADILNHSVNNNAYLIFGEDDMKMVALKKIKKGEEIFNTFGKLGNAELLQMYGYTDEEPNVFDSLPILVNNFFEAVEKKDKENSTDKSHSESIFQAKVSLLNKTEIALVDDFFLFDRNGMRKGPDIIQMLKILFMSDDEFEELLMSRAGNRPDSFYQKLLRKLKLARKTDTSSGVAIIDITDEELDIEIPPKRKIIDSQEIDDAEPPFKQGRVGRDSRMTYMSLAHPAQNLPLNTLHSQYSAYESGQVTHSNGGNSKSNAIVIDDSDEEGDENDLKSSDKNTEDTDTGKETEDKERGNSGMDDSAKDTEEKIQEEGDESKEKSEESNSDKNKDDEENKTESMESTDNSDKEKTEKSQTETKDDNEGEKDDAVSKTDKTEGEESSKKDSEDTEKQGSTEKMDTAGEEDQETKVDDKESDKDSSDKKAKDSEEKSSDDVKDTDEETTDKNIEKKSEEETEKTGSDAKVNGSVSDVVSIGDDNEDEEEGEEDPDDIEIVSEDIRCKMTYANLNKELKPEWREFLIGVLTNHINQLKQDEEMSTKEARAKMNDRQFYAYQIRQGHRHIVKTFISSLGT